MHQRGVNAQLPDRLFSPSKKLSHHFLLHFPIGMGSYDHLKKYPGVFLELLQNTFFKRVPYQLENAIKSGGSVFHLG